VDGVFRRTLPTSKAAPPKPEGISMNNWINTTVAYFQARAARNDRGQTAVEYLGIIAVVVAIVVLIANTNLGQTIVDKLTTQIGKVAP
jgi:pilus assembly protein Flp/PilA